jgi:hypothetical protein
VGYENLKKERISRALWNSNIHNVLEFCRRYICLAEAFNNPQFT